MRILILKSQILFMVFVAAVAASSTAQAQMKKKMDLDDLSVKGEMHSDDRLSILARQKNDLRDYIHYRKEFRAEIYQELPQEKPLKNKNSN